MIAVVPGKFVVSFEPRKGIREKGAQRKKARVVYFFLIMIIWNSLAGMCICCTLDALC